MRAGAAIASGSDQAPDNTVDDAFDSSFWKLASVHVYQGEPSEQRDPLADAVAQSQIFCNKTSEYKSEKSIFNLMIKLPKSSCEHFSLLSVSKNAIQNRRLIDRLGLDAVVARSTVIPGESRTRRDTPTPASRETRAGTAASIIKTKSHAVVVSQLRNFNRTEKQYMHPLLCRA